MPEGFDPNALGTPNRGTGEQELDQWNQAMRQSRIYQDFMRQHSLATNGHVRLSRQQQASLEAELRANGFNIPSGMHIDQGGNLNQKNRLVRNAAIGAGVVGGGLAALGAAGMGPLGAALGGGGGGSVAAGGALPAIEGAAPWAVTPYAGSATMVGTGLGAGAGAAGAAGAGTGAAGLFGGMSARDLAGLGVGLAGTVGGAMSNPPNLDPTTQTSDPNLQALMRTMQGRLDKSEPLYDSVLNMANGLLPTQYQRGGGGMG
jgi:hypothetical protein